jgi:hypothetical protein
MTPNIYKHNYYKIDAKIYKKKEKHYFKLKYNQLLIFDSLLESGSHSKKYIDNNNNYRYSEHFGLLEFNNKSLINIIISAQTIREDKNDFEILLPDDTPKEHEYMFHTHPATPYPGSRAIHGIIYEFPSVSDIDFYIEHYNYGNTQGSIIIAPEGIYIILANKNIKKIIPPEKKILIKIEKELYKIQKLAIKEYGHDIDLDKYYNEIINNKLYLKMYNKLLEKYLGKVLKIYYKPRKYNHKIDKWIVNSIILPIIPYVSIKK